MSLSIRKSQLIETHIQRFQDRVEVITYWRTTTLGFIGRLLAPKGGEVGHFDRFILPSVAQVEYRLEGKHLLTTSALVLSMLLKPVCFAMVSNKWIPFAVFGDAVCAENRQTDIDMLKAQTEQLGFEGEHIVIPNWMPLDHLFSAFSSRTRALSCMQIKDSRDERRAKCDLDRVLRKIKLPFCSSLIGRILDHVADSFLICWIHRGRKCSDERSENYRL